MDYKIEKKSALKIQGVKRRISQVNNQNLIEIPKFWEDFGSMNQAESLVNHIGPLGLLGVCYNDDQVGMAFDYMIGVEAHKDLNDQEIEELLIPETTWAVFKSKGKLPEAIQKVWAEIFDDFFVRTSYIHAKLPELEVYPDGDTSSEDYECEVWIPIEA